MILHELPESGDIQCPVVVVGAGPAGLVSAMELRRHGVIVTVLAGGLDHFDKRFQALADAQITDAGRHAPMQLAVRRALGGTSLLWGGRCVPFDDIDFQARPHIPLGFWPVSATEMLPWYERAIGYLDAGAARFTAPLAGLDGTAECRLDRLERWSKTPDLRRLHAATLREDTGLRVLLGAVATDLGIDPASGRITHVAVQTPSGVRTKLRPRAVVLACGGLETTRLLLIAQRDRPALFGGPDGALGRYYMGHLEGQIAEIVFAPSVPDAAFDFFIDSAGRYVRRRITLTEAAQQRHGLLNLAMWPDNPPLGHAAHRSSILSLAYLSLATPGLGGFLAPAAIRRKHLEHGVADLPRHLDNIARGLPQAAREAAKFLFHRYVSRPRVPGFFIRNAARRYAAFYHAEQAPNRDSTVTLGSEHDELGMPRLRIDLRYGEIDARSVVASHAVIARELEKAGIARLEYSVPEAERVDRILAMACDGYHQIGTTRMSTDPAAGVVDRNCRVHDTPNLFIASSSVFPTAGQANPTLLVAAFAARLAAYLAPLLPGLPEP